MGDRGRYSLKRRLFEIADEYGIDVEKERFEAYTKCRQYVPETELPHWPENLHDVGWFNETTFFVRPGAKLKKEKERPSEPEVSEVQEDDDSQKSILKQLRGKLAVIEEEKNVALQKVNELEATIFSQGETISQLRRELAQSRGSQIKKVAESSRLEVGAKSGMIYWDQKSDPGDNGKVIINEKLSLFSDIVDPYAIRIATKKTFSILIEVGDGVFILHPILFREFIANNKISSEDDYLTAIGKIPSEKGRRFFPDDPAATYFWSKASKMVFL